MTVRDADFAERTQPKKKKKVNELPDRHSSIPSVKWSWKQTAGTTSDYIMKDLQTLTI
jgi:hypothetical protein